MITLLVLNLIAGKLADGWKGTAYGPAGALADTAPAPDCLPNPTPSVRWACPTVIGEHTYVVGYNVDAATGLFFGVQIVCSDYTECAALKAVLDTAWGWCRVTSNYGALPACQWEDGGVIAAWTYNNVTHEGGAITLDGTAYRTVKAAAAKRASSAAEGL